MRKRPETVTASDIAEFVYCPEAWRLVQLDHRPTNQPARDAGTLHHARKAAVERAAGGFIALGRMLILLAIELLLAYAGKAVRSSPSLTDARTVDLDDLTLYFRRFGLSGRPDRILEGGIREKWKSGNRV